MNKSHSLLKKKKQVKLALEELKLLIHGSICKNEDEKKIVNNRLDYLIEASEKQNKFDWKSIAVSTLLGIATSLSLDTEKGRLLFELFKKVFSIVPLILG